MQTVQTADTYLIKIFADVLEHDLNIPWFSELLKLSYTLPVK